MSQILLQQALYLRPDEDQPRQHARSSGFLEAWQADVEQMLIGFGDRPAGVRCPGALFAQPLGDEHVAIVQAADAPLASGLAALVFHVLVMPLDAYGKLFGDPFAIASCFPPPLLDVVGELPVLSLPAEPLPPRTVAEVQGVLKRVKASALREDEDPETIELTVENAESPALLGGVQVLVDGGKLVFVRSAPDAGLIRGLWLLLPHSSRAELWPATFAFGNALGFDAVVVPRLNLSDFPGYTTEQQAADYPPGRYELSLQTAAESGDQAALDSLFGRRSARDTLRLAVVMVVALSLMLLVFRLFDPFTPDTRPPEPLPPDTPVWSSSQRERAAIAAAIVSNPQPFSAVGLQEASRYRDAERAASAAALIGVRDPLAAAVQLRAAQARYVDIWKR